MQKPWGWMMDTRRFRTIGEKKKFAVRKIELGYRIRKFRIKAGLTQDELAQAVGLTRTSIVNMESGKQQPPITLLQEFCAALKITAGKLVNNLDVDY